jgi:hypothetical protein
MTLPGFRLPFGGELNPNNRWVKMAKALDWDALASPYYKVMCADDGRPAKSARLVIAAVIIKHKLNFGDEETIEQIRENPYLQYFAGFYEYRYIQAFAPSLFVEIRKRLGAEIFADFEQSVLASYHQARDRAAKRQENNGVNPIEVAENTGKNAGKLIVDATVAEQMIRYPTDISLLNEAREISENLIDDLYPQSSLSEKPRTYRKDARRDYLSVAKNKKSSRIEIRQAICQQLQYLETNISNINKLLDAIKGSAFPLPALRQRQFWIIQHVLVQQSDMYKNETNRCDDRIVSISQAHVRPIKRGRAGKPVEFGSKLSVSLVDGLAFVDRICWDAFNEGGDLIEQVEKYKIRHGHYPEKVLADGIYGSRNNRNYLKEKRISFGGRPLGRSKKETPENADELREIRQKRQLDARDRIPIEGKFGQGKNGYRLNMIRARLVSTSEAWIRSIFFVMNIVALLKKRLFPKTGG